MAEKMESILAQHLGYHFQDPELLEQALRHRSLGQPNNERLEFLGDAILGFLISDELYRCYPTAKEGELSRMRAVLVNRDMLANLANDLTLNQYLLLGIGERKSGGEKRHSILADVVEAIIGAIYLDSGIDQCRSCIRKWFGDKIDKLSSSGTIKDPKSTLQELLQAKKFPLPTYECSVSGKAHEQIFHVVCTVKGLSYRSEGTSLSRRSAEQIAAKHFLELLHHEE